MMTEMELDEIRCYGISARSRDGFVLPDVPPGEEEPPVQMSVRVRIDRSALGVRVRTDLLAADAEVQVDFGARYSAPKILEYPPALIADFVAEVAVDMIFPFIREAVADVTRRVGAEPQLLGLQQQPNGEWVGAMAEEAAKLQKVAAREAEPQPLTT